MKLGLIGVGVVGGTLKKYFQEKTDHKLACHDPGKGLDDDFTGVEAVFISVPVRPSDRGQDLSTLKEAVAFAQGFTRNVFIRSTVLPGTNDKLGTVACPEFLTERFAYEDMCNLPILVGSDDALISYKIFPDKKIIRVSNKEAELAKFAHNCFGAMKVTYFNMIYEICKTIGADYNNVRNAAMITGYINHEHTQVPGPDGKRGYGGKCFPENMAAFGTFLDYNESLNKDLCDFITQIETLNGSFRYQNNLRIPIQSMELS